MNEIANLNYDFNGHTVRVVGTFDEPWFVAQDVCEMLGTRNTSNTTARLDEDKKGVRKVSTPEGDQDLLVVNEKGLYSLILSSRKPSAAAPRRAILKQVSNARAVLDALRDFDLPDDIPGMFLYAIRNTVTGNIKLGVSRDPSRRLAQLQTGNYCRLELLAVRESGSGFQDEKALHVKYSDSRVRGEWFSGKAELN